ncbi:hypothetical protein M413DRAFT_442839 [Hebeloma cylindrosporum]|uniref:Uncharacterized protein n=1 Tax=Hebeloma cylindrosporum TaxID=76867 RepID=A0A0C2Y4S2_HEBCY|nr:hypothetical protein M413DRAFT_442839 [Hebeloma cylindrosporum h7]
MHMTGNKPCDGALVANTSDFLRTSNHKFPLRSNTSTCQPGKPCIQSMLLHRSFQAVVEHKLSVGQVVVGILAEDNPAEGNPVVADHCNHLDMIAGVAGDEG